MPPRLLVPLTLLWLLTACQPQAVTPAPLPRTMQAPGAATPMQHLALPRDPSELTLTFALPHGEVQTTAMGALGFSEPMVALGAVDTPAQIQGISVTPALPLRWQWLGTSTLAFHPEQPLPGSTTFTVQIAAGQKALSGRVLRQGQTWTFRTPRPHVLQSLPPDRAVDIEHTPTLVLVFDQRVDLASVQKSLVLQAGKTTLAVKAELAQGVALAELEKQNRTEEHAEPSLAGRVVLVRATQTLPAGVEHVLHLGPGVRSLEGQDLGEVPFDLHFKTFGKFAVARAGCEGQCDPGDYGLLQLEFTTELAAEGSDAFMHMTPPVPGFSVNCWGRHCQPGGEFQPAKKYTLTVDAGLTDARGQKLGKPFTFAFTTGHRKPELTWSTDGEVLERHARPLRVAVDARNLASIQAKLLPLPQTGLRALLATAEDMHPPALPDSAVAVPVLPTRVQDANERRVFDLEKWLGGQPGLALLDVWSPQFTGENKGPVHLRRLYQVTDLHVAAKVSDRQTIVWVTSYQTGKPVPGVAIQALGMADRVLWQGTTDAQGLATAAGLDLSQEQAQPVLLASKAGDRALLQLGPSEQQSFYGPDVSTPWTDERVAQARPWLFLDKGVYRLGETVHVKGVVRRLDGHGGLSLPAEGTPVTVTLVDPQGREAATTTSKLSKQGTFHVAFTVPAHGTYGSWDVRAVTEGEAATEAFRVLVYRAPKFRMSTKVAPEHVIRGEAVQGVTEAAWYSGGPLAGAQAEFSATGSPSEFAPPGWPEFVFNGPDRQEQGVLDYLTQQGKGKLDEQGRWQFQVSTQVHSDRPLHVEVEATAQDPNGQPVSSSAAFWLHPAAFSLGVALASGVVQVGSPVTARLIAATPEGKAVPHAPLQGQWLRREWKSVRVQAMGGQVDWQTQQVDTPVATCKAESALQPVTCTATFDKPGAYLLAAKGSDAQGRWSHATASLYVVGPGAVTWAPPGSDAGPLLVADKPGYKVGEVAKILVKNPVPGAQALVTEEQGQVLRSRLVTLTGGAETIEVPIEARHQPNVFVSVVVFAGRRSPIAVASEDTGAPQLHLGYLALHVDTADRKLDVQVLPSAEHLAPGAGIDVAVQVRDSQGKPRSAEVTLWAVDAGVLALTAAQTPDPLAALYADLPLGVRNFAAIADLVRGRVGEEKGADGGGGGAAAFRGRFRDVAFYADALQAGPDGIARGHFTLPDNLTTFRIMAVAIDGQAFGSADKPVQVSKPLMLLTALPHAVQAGDEFQVAATLRNQTAQAVQGTLTLAVDPGLRIVGPASQPVNAAGKASQEVTFTVHAEQPGTPAVALRVLAGGAEDAVREPVLVLDPKPLQTMATEGIATTDVTETLQKVPQARDDAGGLRVILASSGLVGLQGGLEWLIHYPYGCTEQVASGLLGLLHAELFTREFGLFPAQAKTTPGLIDGAMGKLLAVRGIEPGAFTLWPDGSQPDAEATAWALLVLHDADRLGHAVDPVVFREGAAFLRTHLDAKTRPSYASQVQFDAVRALYLQTLAEIGHPEAGYLSQVKQEALPTDARLMWARAAALGGQKAQARAVLDDLTRQLRLDGATAFLPLARDPQLDGLWQSEVRTNALLLDLMLLVQPDHPQAPQVVRWLVEQREGERWATTQDNAWALRTLARWFRQVEKTPPDFDAVVQLGGKDVGKGAFHQRSLQVVEASVVHKALPNQAAPVTIRKTGPGLLYYGMRYSYASPAGTEVAKNAGLLVKRTVLDSQGKPGRTTLDRGEQVLVLVTVLADAPRRDVAIVDRLPAGLEPVDFGLATASQAVRQRFAAVASTGLDTPSFREFAPGEVRFFVDSLSPGLHTFAYVARASTRGSFHGHGARAELMYRPEVFGTSGPVALTVR